MTDTPAPIDETTPLPDNHDPMATAIAGGYKEPPEPTLAERVNTFIASLEHAVRHNGPVSVAMIAEAKDLLGWVDPKDEVHTDTPEA